MISHFPSSSLILQVAEIGWLFTLRDLKECLEATGNLIFAAQIHIHTLVFHQKHLDFLLFWKIAVIVSFL